MKLSGVTMSVLLVGACTETAVIAPRDLRCVDGESPPCETVVPARDERERTLPIQARDTPETLTFVLTAWSMPAEPVGFDLDGIDSGPGSESGTCEDRRPDFHSAADPLQVGVDDAFASLVPTAEALLRADRCPGRTTEGCLPTFFSREVAEGRLLILVEIVGVDDRVNDPSVEVALYRASSETVVNVDAEGGVLGAQSFVTAETLAPPTTGDILGGRLRVRFPDSVALWSDPPLSVVPRVLDFVELRADLADNALLGGVLGGATTVDQMMLDLGRILTSTGVLRERFESIADLVPSASDLGVCTALSVGYRFEGAPAQRL